MDILSKIHLGNYSDFLPQIEEKSVDVIITDPPFGINYQNNYTHEKHEVLAGDNEKFSYSFLAKESFRLLKDDSAFFCFTGWSEYPRHFLELEEEGFSMKEPIICQKRPSGKTDLYGTFQTNSDWCMFAHKGRFKFKKTKLLKNKRAGTIPNKGRNPVAEYKTRFPSCWFGDDFPKSSENPSFQKKNKIYHPTIKGLDFVKWLILLSTNEGDTVLDPFLGSGTTAVAAKMLNRNFIGCEIDENYYNLSKERLERMI